MRLSWSVTVAGIILLGAGSNPVLQAREAAHPVSPRVPDYKDPAALLPAKTLGYGELRQPGTVLKELASLFEGSALGNFPDSAGKLVAGDRTLKGAAGLLLLLTPEMVAEAQRLQGAAGALTGFNDRGEPEYVFLILPGQSNVPGFLMRTLLTVQPMEPAGDVEGVKLYQPGSFSRGPEAKVSGPTLAMMPGLLLVGTPSAVKDVIHRARGKNNSPSLASLEAFQKTGKEMKAKSGLFLYENVTALIEALQHRKGGPDNEAGKALAVISDLLNPKAVPTVGASLTLEKGTFAYRYWFHLEAGEKSPLVEALPSQPFATELLHYAPAEAIVAAGIANDNGNKRWTQILDVADKIAKASGSQDLPSQHLEQLETALGIKIGADLLDKITNAAIVVDDPFKGDKSHVGPPLFFLVQAADEDTAQALVKDVLPKILAVLGADKDRKPTETKVADQTIFTVTFGRNQEIHYGLHGNIIVLGTTNPASVAAASNAGANKGGLLADKKIRAAVGTLDKPFALMVSKPLPLLLASFFMASATPPAPEPKIDSAPSPSIKQSPPGFPGPDAKPSFPQVSPPRVEPPSGGGLFFKQPENPDPKGSAPPAAEPGPLPGVKGEAPPESPEQMLKKFNQLTEGAGPFIISMTRKPDLLEIDLRQSGLKPMVARMTDFMLDLSFRNRSATPPLPVSPTPGPIRNTEPPALPPPPPSAPPPADPLPPVGKNP